MSNDENLAEEMLLEFFNGVEAGIAAAKQRLEKKKGIQEKKTELPGSENLKDLPWKSYQTKEAARPEEAAWIFANTKGAEALLAILKTKDKSQIGTFEYSLSGAEKQFITRKPLKK
jgi:hypothetical protein